MATARDFDRAMERKLGCTRAGTRHQKWVFTINGRHVGYSMRSHGFRANDRLAQGIVSMMAREMRCSTETWQRILDCPGTRQEYLADLLRGGIISNDEYTAAIQQV